MLKVIVENLGDVAVLRCQGRIMDVKRALDAQLAGKGLASISKRFCDELSRVACARKRCGTEGGVGARAGHKGAR